jgi:hypothetical protein
MKNLFLIGAFVGLFSGAAIAQGNKSQAANQSPSKLTTQQKAEHLIQKYTAVLQLSTEQVSQLTALVSQRSPTINALEEKISTTTDTQQKEKLVAEKKALKADFQNKVMAFLNDSQKDKYKSVFINQTKTN